MAKQLGEIKKKKNADRAQEQFRTKGKGKK